MGRVDWHNATRYSTTKLISACENYVTMLNFTGLPEGHGNKTSKSKSDALNSSPSMCPNPASMDLSPVTLQVYKAGYPPCFLTVVKHLCSDSHHAKAPYDCRFGTVALARLTSSFCHKLNIEIFDNTHSEYSDQSLAPRTSDSPVTYWR